MVLGGHLESQLRGEEAEHVLSAPEQAASSRIVHGSLFTQRQHQSIISLVAVRSGGAVVSPSVVTMMCKYLSLVEVLERLLLARGGAGGRRGMERLDEVGVDEAAVDEEAGGLLLDLAVLSRGRGGRAGHREVEDEHGEEGGAEDDGGGEQAAHRGDGGGGHGREREGEWYILFFFFFFWTI